MNGMSKFGMGTHHWPFCGLIRPLAPLKALDISTALQNGREEESSRKAIVGITQSRHVVNLMSYYQNIGSWPMVDGGDQTLPDEAVPHGGVKAVSEGTMTFRGRKHLLAACDAVGRQDDDRGVRPNASARAQASVAFRPGPSTSQPGQCAAARRR